ncbi:hypothetical protein K8R51_36825 [Rhizobium favelukesii]|nr:hypothetical protein [Rhizobium favelukesii]
MSLSSRCAIAAARRSPLAARRSPLDRISGGRLLINVVTDPVENIVGAIKPGNTNMEAGEVDHRVDLAKQVILRHPAVERHHLESRLEETVFLNLSH